jgi:hypothetical protein
MAKPPDELIALSRALFVRARELAARGNPNDAMIAAIEEELQIADAEASETVTAANRYEAGYHQGWADAIRMILGAVKDPGYDA